MSETGETPADGVVDTITAPTRPAPDRKRPNRGGRVARVVTYWRQVVAELRKVIWPTRNELVTYTAVSLVFVVFMVAFVGLLDYGFTRAIFHVFG